MKRNGDYRFSFILLFPKEEIPRNQLITPPITGVSAGTDSVSLLKTVILLQIRFVLPDEKLIREWRLYLTNLKSLYNASGATRINVYKGAKIMTIKHLDRHKKLN